MSVLQKLENISIPYPTEGIVRTAQLDDTVAPEDSVQLAVNMNFDQIGAIQTRDGVTEYADQLTGEIKNFGTLSNKIFPDGFARISEFQEFATFEATDTNDVKTIAIDDTTYLVIWSGVDSDGFAAVYNVDLTTGAFTLLGGPTEWCITDADAISISRIDSTHFLIVYQGTSSDGFAQVMTVSGGSISMNGSPLEFEVSDLVSNSIAMIDANHFFVCYEGVAGDGFAQVLEVNLGTWAVTAVGTPLEFDTGDAEDISCVAVGDGTHFIVFWDGLSADGYAQCLEVNTGTWAVTAAGASFVFDNGGSTGYNTCQSLGDGEHFINFWKSTTGGKVQVFELDTGTFEITALGTPLTFCDTTGAINNASVSVGDGEHFINTWAETATVDRVANIQIFNVDPLTFEVTAISNLVEFGDTQSVVTGSSAISITISDDYRPVVAWILPDNTGRIMMFETTALPTFQKFLYAQQGDYDVYNWDGANWVSRRSGLGSTKKARFAQYLDYIWMVNGNELEEGDPVQTSNGGAFGTDLVPDNFPPGDFISAGFEGRVWVVDALSNTIYYSDIVQFLPPYSYSLDYDPDVNFISNLSPNTGQSFTGIIEVPRALLVFTQDNIYRIYGATSVDSYPAYNVGTYSQESIVQTKTGIFFHHSSGFYQFDYGSQPIEISRRVIDFVEAIPRSYYEDITGVYDGFDAIEWSVGPVTVEGVTFSNCVMRYTISTQIWTIYDYVGNTITAMISYDDGTTLNHLMGTSVGKVGAMDVGTTDFGEPFYFEYIDRWRAFTPMYYQQKNIGSINVYSENAGGVNIMYQTKKSGVNAWEPIGTLNQKANSIIPTTDIGDFDVLRFRMAGNTKGTPVVIHGIEIPEITIKGQDDN